MLLEKKSLFLRQAPTYGAEALSVFLRVVIYCERIKARCGNVSLIVYSGQGKNRGILRVLYYPFGLGEVLTKNCCNCIDAMLIPL
jgi:hypothetical protein